MDHKDIRHSIKQDIMEKMENHIYGFHHLDKDGKTAEELAQESFDGAEIWDSKQRPENRGRSRSVNRHSRVSLTSSSSATCTGRSYNVQHLSSAQLMELHREIRAELDRRSG